ncbi:GLPGLI family protein [Aquimarina sp. BL5]|uniref:GLPGLI family protein n=1 Tax=Aquimarina sp. BL5 TaxID=1714860 RepID=UPI000E484DF3|nr:GLPGLI family protein [Aquimarina sp. BL5]AXT50641.1 GLPGLI family protein [Aquimarina sp. BL5]RKN07123.1 GLPGLI family protein [Aquimarina sp. BL5]
MKKLLLPTVVLFSVILNAQQITVFYKEKRIPDQVTTKNGHFDSLEFEVYMLEMAKIKAAIYADKDKDSLDYYRNKIQEEVNKMMIHSKKIERKSLNIPEYDYITVLKIRALKSLYYPQEEVGNDTVSEIRTNRKGREFKRERINYNNSEVVYIDQSQRKKISSLEVYEFDLKGRKFLIEEALEQPQWTLTKETKKIDQYVCYKAILKNSDKKVEAWYTREIKSAHGPKGYCGLPGLILELKEDKRTVNFHKIRILSENGFEINPPTEGEKITRQELIDLPAKLFNQY